MARILIVDDNLMIRTLLREILSSAGHDVVGEAQDGLEAPGRVSELRPDLVTLDLVMPGRDGITTLSHLRMLDPSLAVIVCSASLDQRRVIAALKLGAKGFILKPFKRDLVLETVRSALAGASRDSARRVPVATMATDWAAEQREFARVKARLPIIVTLAGGGAPLDTHTLDIAGGGMLLAGGSFEVGARVEFHLELGPGEAPIDGRARVARITDAGLPGLAFEQVSIADHERLTRYIHDRHAPLSQAC